MYPPLGIGGAERSVQYLARALAARGHDVLVLSRGIRWRTVREVLDGVTVVRMGSPPGYRPNIHAHFSLGRRVMTRLMRPLAPDRAKFYLDELKAFRPDVVHSNTAADVTRVWRGLEKLGVPVVHTLRNPSLLCDRRMFAEGKSCQTQCGQCLRATHERRQACLQVSGVVGISSSILQEHLVNGYFRTSAPRRVIPNSYEPRAIAWRPREPGDPLRLGYVGRLHETKGVEELLHAAKRFAGRASLVVAGTGNPRFVERLKAFAAGEVEFVGFVEPAAVYEKLDALVVPSLWNEPFGRVYAEALVHGIPVVGSIHGAGRELVSEGETGWLCDPTESASIEFALERCIGALSDPDVQARMRARCFESARRFASEPVAAAYEEVYRVAIDEHRRRRSSQGTAHLPVLGGAFART